MVLVLGGSVGEVQTALVGEPVWQAALHLAAGLAALLSLALALSAARQRRRAEHVEHVVYFVSWVGAAGVVRLAGFLLEYFLPCSFLAFNGPECVIGVLNAVSSRGSSGLSSR